MGRLSWLLVVCFFSLVSCRSYSPQSLVSSKSSDGVVGGQIVTDAHAFAHNIVAVYDAYNKNLCTGSLLENNLVLTAAHCVVGDSDLVIIFARDVTPRRDTSKPLIVSEVDNYEFAPQWLASGGSGRDRGDLVLLHFVGEAPAGFEPSRILKEFSQLKPSILFSVAGFGVSNVHDSKSSGVLRTAQISVANANYSSTETLADQSKGQGACRGDSGGPAYLLIDGQYYLWGVTSRGSNDKADDCSQLSIFTNLEKFTPWMAAASARLKSSSHGDETAPVKEK